MAIPKKLWFIWFGNKPSYVDFCINSFKKMNPDFEIYFIYKDKIEIDENDEIDKSIKTCMDWIKNPSECKYKSLINYDIKQNFPYNVLLSNILRVYIINKYGGIYLDCDTFPIKPFDDKLLSLQNFCITTLSPNGLLYKGRYFFGREVNSSSEKKMLYPTRITYNNSFLENYKKFRECNLEEVTPDNKLTYIEHFTMRYYKQNDS